MRISDWSSDVCSSDLIAVGLAADYCRSLHRFHHRNEAGFRLRLPRTQTQKAFRPEQDKRKRHHSLPCGRAYNPCLVPDKKDCLPTRPETHTWKNRSGIKSALHQKRSEESGVGKE